MISIIVNVDLNFEREKKEKKSFVSTNILKNFIILMFSDTFFLIGLGRIFMLEKKTL